MKKSLFILLFAVLLTACGGKEDEPATVADLNVKQLTEYVGKTAEYVKSDFKSGELITEGGTLGKTTLSYFLTTKMVKYSVTFKTDTKGIVDEVDVFTSLSTYKEGVETFKSEMDKIDSSIKHEYYSAYYNSKSAGLIAFNDRNEFWEYVAENDVSTFIEERWSYNSDNLIKLSISGNFVRSSAINNNGFSIEIKKSKY